LLNRKFSLEKVAKLSNIDDYTIYQIDVLDKKYSEFLKKYKGRDPDYPMIKFKLSESE